MTYRVGYDAVAALIDNIPRNAQVVGGYVTGGPGIEWEPGMYGLFPNAGKLYIDQGHGNPWKQPNVIDVETGDYSPADIPSVVARYAKLYGEYEITVYCMISNLETVASYWKGPVWLACPSYPTTAQVLELVKQYPGIRIVAAQNVWVNAKYDQSVILDESWPAVSTPPKPKPAPPKTVTFVATWEGTDGVISRKTTIPYDVWATFKWVDPE
jgi:hypothetical protein